MWLLPSRQRVGNLKRFFRACRETGLTTPGLVLVNEEELRRDRIAYAPVNLDLPETWQVVGVTAACFHDALRAAWGIVKDLPWAGLLQDDLVPQTADWDQKLVARLNGWNVVSASDGRGTGRMHGAIAWSGDLLRAMGWMYPPGFKHLYGDDVWETLGRETLCWTYRHDVVTHHLNETYQASADATARTIRAHSEPDRKRFETWLAREKGDCVRRIAALRERCGFRAASVDVTNVRLAIATPCGSGRYEGRYRDSLDATLQYLRGQAIPCGTLDERYCADVTLARAKLFSAFLRTNCTHLLWIDDDMGWDVSAVIRLLVASKEFVAAAGPKKEYPIKFAVNCSSDDGDWTALRVDKESGLIPVSEVGLAFAMMTRACCEKMARAYPDLSYRGPNGEIEHAPFIPMVRHNRYLPEDFAFCQRWRLIGGEVWIAPDVRLTHTGAHTFEGKLGDSLKPKSK